MAKKSPAKKQKTKTVDVAKNKTPRAINAIAKNVEKEFRTILKNTNIVVLDHIQKEMTLDRYFLNRDLFVRLLGENIHRLDYAFRVAVAQTIQDTLMDNLTRDDSVYPGYWKVEFIVIPMAHIAILEGSDTPGEWYFSIKIGATSVNSAEALMQAESGEVPDAMNFKDYNPNRLAQMIYKVSIMITQTIMAECKRYPTAKLYQGSDGATCSIRYANEFRQYITDENEFEFEITGVPPYDKNITEYLNALEKRMVVYFCYMLSTAGVNDEVIKSFVSQLKLHAIYNAEKAKTLADVAVSYLMVVPDLKTNNQVMFTFTIKELAYILSNTDKETDSRKFQFGTKLKMVMNQLVDVCTTMVIESMESDQTATESAAESGLPDIG